MKHFWLLRVTAIWAGIILFSHWVSAADHPSRGLWVGEVNLTKVNEVSVGINDRNQVVASDPQVPTPAPAAASLRLILHVDNHGQVRLLKSVALLNKSEDPVQASLALVTDESLFPAFSSLGKKIASVAFDFGEKKANEAVKQVADAVAAAAAEAAGAGFGFAAIETAAANAGRSALMPAGATDSPALAAFLRSSTYTNSPKTAATAAARDVLKSRQTGGTPADLTLAARIAAATALASVFVAADAVPVHEVKLTGNLAPGENVTGSFFLGAYHPTNPFRHRRHPDHGQGYEIVRTVALAVNQPPSGESFEPGGFGVDRLTGVYREEVNGLHKPLGPSKNIGLKTEGTFNLHRISLVDTLNQ